jgi:hypothetical protein
MIMYRPHEQFYINLINFFKSDYAHHEYDSCPVGLQQEEDNDTKCLCIVCVYIDEIGQTYPWVDIIRNHLPKVVPLGITSPKFRERWIYFI